MLGRRMSAEARVSAVHATELKHNEAESRALVRSDHSGQAVRPAVRWPLWHA